MTSRRLALATLVLLALAAGAPAFAADPAVADPAAAAPQAGGESPPLDGPNFTPAPEPMAPPCAYCATGLTTSPGGGAASHWGHGSSCTESQTDVRNQLLAFVNADCFSLDGLGRCSFQVVYTNACWYDYGSGQYVTDAYANYGCWLTYC